MSLPTPYYIDGDEGKYLGASHSSTWAYEPLQRASQPEDFFYEVGELIVEDIAVYCAGRQENETGGFISPSFSLADIAVIKSDGGQVVREEFSLCVDAYVRGQQKSVESLAACNSTDEDIKFMKQNIFAAKQVAAELEAITTKRPYSKLPRFTVEAVL